MNDDYPKEEIPIAPARNEPHFNENIIAEDCNSYLLK
jgi:hypothetical protein